MGPRAACSRRASATVLTGRRLGATGGGPGAPHRAEEGGAGAGAGHGGHHRGGHPGARQPEALPRRQGHSGAHFRVYEGAASAQKSETLAVSHVLVDAPSLLDAAGDCQRGGKRPNSGVFPSLSARLGNTADGHDWSRNMQSLDFDLPAPNRTCSCSRSNSILCC